MAGSSDQQNGLLEDSVGGQVAPGLENWCETPEISAAGAKRKRLRSKR